MRLSLSLETAKNGFLLIQYTQNLFLQLESQLESQTTADEDDRSCIK